MNRILQIAFSFFLSFIHNWIAGQTPDRHPVFLHDTIAESGHLFFNHAPQILFLENGLILPNGDTLDNNRIIISAFGGLIEGGEDQNIWYAYSDDEGETWTSPDSLLVGNEHLGPKIGFNGSLFLGPANKIIQFILFQNGPGGGADPQYPIFLKYKFSDDGGNTWSDMIEPEVIGIEDTSQFRIIGPYCKPVEIHPDTFGFPLYYRFVGNPNAFFGFLKVSKDLDHFELQKFPAITLNHPDRLIEPLMLSRNDTLFTYFRTTAGRIWFFLSEDNGISWEGPHYLQVPHPGTLFSGFVSGTEQFLVANLSTQRREHLSLIHVLNGNKSPVFLKKIDNIDSVYYQVTYPSIDISHPAKILISYSGIGLDINKGRFGDIFFKAIPKDSLNFWVVEEHNTIFEDKIVRDSLSINFTLLNSAASIGDDVYVSESHGKTYRLLSNGQGYSIISSPEESYLYTQILSGNDSLILSTSNGWKYSHPTNINWLDGPFNGADSYKAIAFGENENKWLLFRNKNIKYYENDEFIREANLPDLYLVSGNYRNINLVGVKETGEILILTDLGETYYSADTLKTLSLSPIASFHTIPTALIRYGNSWLCGTALGACYQLQDGFLNWALVKTNDFKSPVQQILLVKDSIILLYSSGFELVDSNFITLSSVFYDPSSISLFEAFVKNDTLLMLDALGFILSTPFMKNVNSSTERHDSKLSVKPLLYPNPTSGTVHFKDAKPLQWEIWSLNGNLLLKSNIQHDLGSMENLPPGLYFLVASFQNQKYIYKVIKQ